MQQLAEAAAAASNSSREQEELSATAPTTSVHALLPSEHERNRSNSGASGTSSKSSKSHSSSSSSSGSITTATTAAQPDYSSSGSSVATANNRLTHNGHGSASSGGSGSRVAHAALPDGISLPNLPKSSQPASGSASSNGGAKRIRVARACDACRRKKVRCNLSGAPAPSTADGSPGTSKKPAAAELAPGPPALTSSPLDPSQSCANCIQSGLPCTFTKSPAKRGPNPHKGYIQQLETRLAALENVSPPQPGGSATDGLPGFEYPQLEVGQAARRKSNTTIVPQIVSPDANGAALSLQSTTATRAVDLAPPPAAKKQKLDDGISTSNAPRAALSHGTPPTDRHSFLHTQHPHHHQAAIHSATLRDSAWHPPPHLQTRLNSFAPLPGSGAATPSFHPHQQRSSLPPISRLLSEVPASSGWPPSMQHQHTQALDSSSHPRNQYYTGHWTDNHSRSSTRPPTPTGDETAHHLAAHPNHPSPSTQSQQSQFPYPQNLAHPPNPAYNPQRSHQSHLSSSLLRSAGPRENRSASIGSASTPLNRSPKSEVESPFCRKPLTGNGTGANTPTNTLLGRLDNSAILSLDSLALRKALFHTPALQTFHILPHRMLEGGLEDNPLLVKAAYLLSSSSATLSFSSATLDDSQWQSDVSSIVGQCMVPLTFQAWEKENTIREVETLALCYVDSVRRGRHVPGLMGAIAGKLQSTDRDHPEYKRQQAAMTLLAVWHALGHSSSAIHLTCAQFPSTESFYEAFDTRDPVLKAVCRSTWVLDRLLRRLRGSGTHSMAEGTIELGLPRDGSWSPDLPLKQLRLLSALDSFVLMLAFLHNHGSTDLPSFELLERQRYHLGCVCNEHETGGLYSLLVGPHVLALAAVFTVYCLAASRDRSHTSTTTSGYGQSSGGSDYHSLSRDFLAALDGIKNLAWHLASPPDASLVNSSPFADSGDMRLLYLHVSYYVKVHIASAASPRAELLDTKAISDNFQKLGYLGSILAINGEENDSSASF